MDGIGPESKRQRLEYGSQRPQPPTAQSHNYNGILPPPPSSHHPYQPPHQPPPPPSPYDVGSSEHRSLPDSTPHAYVQAHSASGQNTPVREQRFLPEPNYSRRNSASAVARSPEEHHPFTPGRSMSIATTADGQHFPPTAQFATESGGHLPGFPPGDGPPNGNIHHGLPHHYETPHNYPQAHPLEYGHSPVTTGHPYAGIPYGPPYGPSGARALKKGNRATQACDICRTRKAKCDEGRPNCSFCVENNLRCNYQSVAPAKADRANQQIIDQLASQKDDMKALKEDWERRFDRIEQILVDMSAGRGLAKHAEDTKPSILQLTSQNPRDVADQEGSFSSTMPKSIAREQSMVDESPNDSSDSTIHDPVTTQNNAIYVEHDTAAQKLFRWPSIKALLRKSKKLQFSERAEDYVMNLETNKGVLRVYGRGRQTRDSSDRLSTSSTTINMASPVPSSTSGPSDESSEGRSPASSPESQWGCGFVPTFPTTESKSASGIGGLNSDNTLKLDRKTVEQLLDSYLRNLHILHPFLDERELSSKVEHFVTRYDPHESHSSKAAFAIPVAISNLDPPTIFHRPAKRKLSDAPYYSPEAGMSSKPLLDRSPTTARMLLVMALGKICLYKKALPGPVPDGSKDNSSFPPHPYSPSGGRIDSPPFSRQSPTSSSLSTVNASMPSPMSGGRVGDSSPRPSVGENPVGVRNVDVIPGLAYYAQATDILGNIAGLHELVYAQCCLLAGLYAGQLANALESLTWIQCASRVCRFLVREPLLNNVKETKRDLIRLAFWTSLQLESDILAELDIPRSGIQDIQDVPYPKGFVDQAEKHHPETAKEKIMIYYSYQLHMRKLLNDIQKELYQEKDANFKRATRSQSLRDAFNAMIEDWRESLPEALRWDDDEAPASDINDARLRGKFYGAQYIIHRPFLHAALEYDLEPPNIHSPSARNHRGSQGLPSFHRGTPTEPHMASMRPPKVSPSSHEQERRKATIELARICINAARNSTLAFDGVNTQSRMIVTNIMGTAHAQFGNMLVLSAAFMSKTLGAYIERHDLENLFDRTIKMLSDLEAISTTLGRDCYILRCLRAVVFESGGAGSAISSSFGSQ